MNEQGTPEWIHDRCGNVGGSRIADVIAKPLKGRKEATSRRNYKADLISELLTGKAKESYVTWEMKRGTELEPEARMEYELRRGVMVESTGFIMHPTIPRAGASPDGLVGDDLVLEIKCLKTASHLEYLMAGVVPTEYKPQMAWEMACSGRQGCDFVSYEPDLPDHLKLFIIRYKRDDVYIAELEAEVIKFNAEIDEIISKLPTPDGTTYLERKLKESLHLVEVKP